MTAEHFELEQARVLLQKFVDSANELLNNLEAENENRDGYLKEKAAERIKVFDNLINAITFYDNKVIRYQQFNPPGAGYQFYKTNFAKAKKYIKALGGNPENIVYYNITDFQ